MGFKNLFRRLTERGTAGAPAPAAPLKYSDYASGAAIVTGLVGSSAFVAGLNSATVSGPEIVGGAVLLTTILTTLSQWLQSKGD